MTNKDYCLSSYLAFRFIERDDMDFFDGMHHHNIELPPDEEKISVETSDGIGTAIEKQLDAFRDKSCGILLSGGMDSAIVASYMNGGEAYTFRFLGGDFQKEELARAEYYAKYYNLNLHYVDISWDTVEKHLPSCMESKCAPVHSIEPQICQAALQAQNDGVEMMFIGDGSDYIFGGMDKLLSKDWYFDDFVERYFSINPTKALINPVAMTYPFEPFRLPNGKIDFQGFMAGLMTKESFNSYYNAFKVAGMPYHDPYSRLKMAGPLDLNRIRNGEPKYLIRELMAKRYPEIPVPDKNPMPRPVDFYFADWKGPKRHEFKQGLDMSEFTGNQKWQLWCAETFLNFFEK